MLGPAEAAKRIRDYVPVDMPPKKAEIVLLEIIEDLGWASGSDAADFAAEWTDKFVVRLRKLAAVESDLAKVSCFEFNSINANFIQGSCFIEPKNSEAEAAAKRLRANMIYYERSFEVLENDEFEVLCSRILGLWNVEKEFVTRASADQGIDFFGRVAFGEIMKSSAIGPGAEKQRWTPKLRQVAKVDCLMIRTIHDDEA